MEGLDTVWKKIKNRKVAGLDKIPSKIWKTKFDDIILHLCNAVFKQNATKKWTKGCILTFLKKGDLRGITAKAAKVYNALLLNRIWLESKKILRKNEKSFWGNLTDSNNLYNHWRSLSKESLGNMTVCRFLKNIWFHTQRKDGAYCLPKETVSIIMMLYKNNGLLTW